MRNVLKLFVFFSFFFLCDCCVTNIIKPLSSAQVAKIVSNDTVALMHDSKPFCTGVWVSQDTILTANHCVDGLVKFLNDANDDTEEAALQSLFPWFLPSKIVIPLGLTIPFILPHEVVEVGKAPSAIHNSIATVLYKDLDLALLKAVGTIPDHGIAKLANNTPEQGDRIHTVGHTVGLLYWTYTPGYVSAYRRELTSITNDIVNGPFMQVSGPMFFGNSGGGAFNDDGELVGIFSFIVKVPNTSFCIHLKTIRAVLNGNKIIPIVLNLDPRAVDPSLED